MQGPRQLRDERFSPSRESWARSVLPQPVEHPRVALTQVSGAPLTILPGNGFPACRGGLGSLAAAAVRSPDLRLAEPSKGWSLDPRELTNQIATTP
jgi:hypothetical protein